MFKKNSVRKTLALILCLVLLSGMASLPVLAAPGDQGSEPVEAPVERAEAPAKEEAPAEKAETPAKEEAPAEKAETPAKEEKTAEKEETPAKEEAPAEKEETPAKEEKTSQKEETPVKEETPAEKEETPAPAKATPAPTKAPARSSQAPVRREEPKVEEPQEEEPEAEPQEEAPVAAASLFGLDQDDDNDNDFVIDWDDEEIQQGTWAGQVGAVETSAGFYIYVATPTYSGAYVEIATPGEYGNNVALWVRCDADWGDPGTAMSNGAPIPGSNVRYYEAGGTRHSEIFIPKSALPDSDEGYIVQVSGDAILFDFSVDALSDADAVYDGITIDGKFSDWAAVPKTEADNDPPAHNPFHTSVDMAVVWDGDYVYIYFGYVDGNANGLSSYGPLGSGQFSIVTDLGRTMLIRPNINPASKTAVVDGVDGAFIAIDSYDWAPRGHKAELAIPTSALPEYLESFSFGYYMEPPIITDIVNMQDTPGGVDPFKSNVVIDGKYNDWVGYPHALIEYDDPGIQHSKVDGEGALWSNDGWLYGHVVTEHPDHLAEQGSCFLAAIEIAFNGDRAYKDYPNKGNFYPRILAIHEDGTVIDYYKTLNEGHSTPNGTYTYYIFDTRTDPVWQFGHTDENGVWHDATAADLIENAFGTMKVTVTGTRDEAEFQMDLKKVAAYIEQDADTAFKTIDIHWGRIGPQWITTAGTPTGPILGVALLVGAVGVPMCYTASKKRRQSKKSADVTE